MPIETSETTVDPTTVETTDDAVQGVVVVVITKEELHPQDGVVEGRTIMEVLAAAIGERTITEAVMEGVLHPLDGAVVEKTITEVVIVEEDTTSLLLHIGEVAGAETIGMGLPHAIGTDLLHAIIEMVENIIEVGPHLVLEAVLPWIALLWIVHLWIVPLWIGHLWIALPWTETAIESVIVYRGLVACQ